MRLFIYLLTATIFFSCGDNDKSQSVAGDYYVSIATTLIMTKQHQYLFMNRCTSIINDISENKQINVDTAELRLLMDNAKASGSDAISSLENIVEVDTTINLKSKSIDYLLFANNAYDSSFSKWITLIGTTKKDKTASTMGVLYGDIKALSAKRKTFEVAQRDFVDKYNIQTAF
jgi:hypothetical protein